MEQILRKIIVEGIEQGLPEDLMERDIEIDLDTRKVVAISGIRRCGKTYLLYQIMKKFMEKGYAREDVLYINFEDERIPQKTEVLTALAKIIKEFSHEPILLLDEIQNIPDWSRWVHRVEKQFKIFITGSSSKLSSKEIPTELRGRCISKTLMPLSFKEFLYFKGIEINWKFLEYSDNEKTKMINTLNEYLKFGGFPDIVNSDKFKKLEILREYYKTIVERDIKERYGIRNVAALHDFLRLLLNSNQFTISKIHNTLKSLGHKIGKNTVANYTEYVKTSYFMFEVQAFSYKVKNTLQCPRKIYYGDNGFALLSLKFSENIGRLMENLVAIELLRREEEIYYWRDYSGREVDFVVKEDLEIKQLIQVCYDIEDFETKEQELKGLIKGSKELKCNNLLVITGYFEGIETVKEKDVVYVPLWRWLLEKITT